MGTVALAGGMVVDAQMKNLGRDLLDRGWHLPESWLQVGPRSLNLFQRLRGHGLLVPSVKKAAP